MRRSRTSIRHQQSTPFTSSNADVSVYTLMKLLDHEFTAAGTETRTAAAANKLYDLIEDDGPT